MNYLSILAFFLFLSCDSQINSKRTEVQFEDVYHHYFNLTSEKFLILDSQEKVDKLYEEIGNHYGGKRSPPIPQVNSEEKFVLFKPILKNTNDVQILKVELENNDLFIKTKPFYNPENPENNRVAPYILIKVYTNQNIKKVITENFN